MSTWVQRLKIKYNLFSTERWRGVWPLLFLMPQSAPLSIKYKQMSLKATAAKIGRKLELYFILEWNDTCTM